MSYHRIVRKRIETEVRGESPVYRLSISVIWALLAALLILTVKDPTKIAEILKALTNVIK